MWPCFFVLCSCAVMSAGGAASKPSLQQQHRPLGEPAAPLMQAQQGAAGGRPQRLRLAPSVDASGVFQHRLCALDTTPATAQPGEGGAGGESFALVLVNYKLSRPLLERLWSNATVRMCADGAINRLYRTFDDDETRSRFIPEYIRGDLDSVEDDVRAYYEHKGTKIVQDTSQDTTDLQKCIELLLTLDLEINQVVVMGAFGGRIDHEFSHYHVLYRFPYVNIVLISQKRVAFLLVEGKHQVHDTHVGPMCGLIPLGDPCKRVHTEGLQWDLDGKEMSFTGLISTSNKMVASPVSISTTDPLVWVAEIQGFKDHPVDLNSEPVCPTLDLPLAPGEGEGE